MAKKQFDEVISPIVDGMGYEYVGLEYLPQGRHSVLRVYIDGLKGAGVNIDDCAAVSKQISAVLDVEDIIRGTYTLEVSSPGLNRPLFTLEQFQQHTGQRAKICLHGLIEGRRNLVGLIQAVENDSIVFLEDDEAKLFNLSLNEIDKANLIAELKK